MARIRSGILGNIRGKVAGVVGSQWKDINYLREYVKPANPNSAAQQVQRSLMSAAVAFAKVLVGPIFNAYTDRFYKGMSGFNAFIKRNIAVFVAVPDFTTIQLTEGKLSALGSQPCTYDTATGEVTINWLENYGNNGASDDKVFWIIYDQGTGLFYFAPAEIARDSTPDVQTIVSGLTVTDLHAYVFAAKYAGTIVSMVSWAFVDVLAAP